MGSAAGVSLAVQLDGNIAALTRWNAACFAPWCDDCNRAMRKENGVARLSTLPTIPDDEAMQEVMAIGWSLGAVEPVAEPDYRARGIPDPAAPPSRAMLRAPRREILSIRETPLDDLIRPAHVVLESTTLRTGAELFASGMEGPVIVVTIDNEPVGLLTAADVLRVTKEHGVHDLALASVLDAATPSGPLLHVGASPQQAAEHFVARDSAVLVTVDDEGKLVGLLHARDLFPLLV
jgi:CBS domain-containing protein